MITFLIMLLVIFLVGLLVGFGFVIFSNDTPRKRPGEYFDYTDVFDSSDYLDD